MIDIQGFVQPGVPVISDPTAPSDVFLLFRSGGIIQARIAKTGVTLGGNVQLGSATSRIGFYGSAGVTKPAALTAIDNAAVNSTYSAEEVGVINNIRTRLNELESRLQSLGLLS